MSGISRPLALAETLFFFSHLCTPPRAAFLPQPLLAGTGARWDGGAKDLGSQIWEGKQTLGYSHYCRLGAVIGCHVEALGMSDAFLCVVKAAFHGCKVGCGGKGDVVNCITRAPLDLEHSMEALEHLSSPHGIL